MGEDPSNIAARLASMASGVLSTDDVASPSGQGQEVPAAGCQGPYASLAELGAGLKACREARGLSQEDVASRLKLTMAVVRSLESGDMTRIRHAAYAKGFLRSYASMMRMPENWYDGVLRQLTPVPAPQESFYRPDKTARMPRKSPVLGVLASLVVAVAAVWAVWHFNVIDLLTRDDPAPTQSSVPLQTFETAPLDQPAQPAASLPGRSDMPAQGQSMASGPVIMPAQDGANSSDILSGGMQQPAQNPNMPAGAGTSASVGSPSLSLAPGMPETDREPLPAVVTPNSPWSTLQGNATLAGQAGLATEPAASANPNLPATEAMLPADGKHNITIMADAMCWTQVTADGGRAVQRTMQPGETISVPFAISLVLRLGNAGGVRLFYDGVEQTDRGRTGQVRTLVFPPKAD